ncbi:hypothetical protein CONLIGDRAFT_236002 [Coniochaeta ligniaria NRRL 30616]|uniref:Uncharacterized protein n=1 Tax=Coniochaeta ligniaria NRRL 30616 TaxID=1408157 RepID=A0A1J7JP62_9PEZI|nr:hypothetical protein CONLIGDRAFT_236002 [Coniochaeta ligniaria NRRL 30616]
MAVFWSTSGMLPLSMHVQLRIAAAHEGISRTCISSTLPIIILITTNSDSLQLEPATHKTALVLLTISLGLTTTEPATHKTSLDNPIYSPKMFDREMPLSVFCRGLKDEEDVKSGIFVYDFENVNSTGTCDTVIEPEAPPRPLRRVVCCLCKECQREKRAAADLDARAVAKVQAEVHAEIQTEIQTETTG